VNRTEPKSKRVLPVKIAPLPRSDVSDISYIADVVCSMLMPNAMRSSFLLAALRKMLLNNSDSDLFFLMEPSVKRLKLTQTVLSLK